MTKADLRRIYTEKRNALTADEYAGLNQGLIDQFKTVGLSVVKVLHIFLTITSRKEPDTRPIINWVKEAYPQIKIVYPKIDFADNLMQSYFDDDNLQLAANKYGIKEPVSGTAVNAKKIDMIILPLLAFDKRGYRVGYGKGFYDRFIAQCREDVQLIGLSFFGPVDEISDIDQYDKKMGACVTPFFRYNF